MRPFAAALKGAEEIGFTVFTISISLIAVFIPLLLMGGIVGRLFREFAVTLSTAILVSMIVSLTTTPMTVSYTHLDVYKRQLSPSASTATSSTGAASAGATSSAPSNAVPLSAFTHFENTTEPLSINHQGQFPAITVSFNLASNAALGNAITAINKVQKDMHMPPSLQADFQGTAASFRNSLTNEPLLLLAALVTVYIVLGVLYESFIPVSYTHLSTP